MPPGLEETVKFLTFITIAGIIGIGVLLYVNKDDLRRYREMRQM